MFCTPLYSCGLGVQTAEHIEDCPEYYKLRKKHWQLYGIEKELQATIRFIIKTTGGLVKMPTQEEAM